jgi:hypothetical protein
MPATAAALLLANEADSLRMRLGQLRSFALFETMVPAAAVSIKAQAGIERQLSSGRRQLHELIDAYLLWLRGAAGRAATAQEAQRRFTIVRLRFNLAVTQFDIYADVMTQRSEHRTGVWLAGLDLLAADALALPEFYDAPPVVCYLDRGQGAAIRRARTRLPGGGSNPVAVIRVPRERMIGAGIASSLVHEVGHQAAALLDLVASLRPVLRAMQRASGALEVAWRLWERWISEILADLWSVARVGIASSLGLLGVMSLPRAFVFRISADDPHPAPYVRMLLSCAIGKALYPHAQWDSLAAMWRAFYPQDGLDHQTRTVLTALQSTMCGFVDLLVHHRPRTLRGASLSEALAVHERQPVRLAELFGPRDHPRAALKAASPSLVFAAVGQARADGKLSPKHEARLLSHMLTHWALQDALGAYAASDARATRLHWNLALEKTA